MRVTGILVAMGLAATALAAGPALLAGSWTATGAERDGAPAAELIGHRLDFTGDRFQITGKNGRERYVGTYRVDDAVQPATIDFHHDGGEAAGKVWEGIYRLDDGRLIIVDDAPDPSKGRPTDFTTTAGSGRVLLVFAR